MAFLKPSAKVVTLRALPGGVEVGEDANAVARRVPCSSPAAGGCGSDHPDAALLVHGQAGRRDDVRLPGDQLDDQAVVVATGGPGRRGSGDEQEQPIRMQRKAGKAWYDSVGGRAVQNL